MLNKVEVKRYEENKGIFIRLSKKINIITNK